MKEMMSSFIAQRIPNSTVRKKKLKTTEEGSRPPFLLIRSDCEKVPACVAEAASRKCCSALRPLSAVCSVITAEFRRESVGRISSGNSDRGNELHRFALQALARK